MPALLLQRVETSGRIVTDDAESARASRDLSLEPFPLARAAGFRIEARPHGEAEMFDPQGYPCGVFASERVATETLRQLAFLLR